MFSKTQRVSRADFATFFKNGRRISGEHALLVCTPFPTLHGSVVVSKKVSKSAVTRNTLRRRVYAQLSGLKSKHYTGVVIVVLKPSFGSLSKNQAKEHIVALIARLIKTA